MKKLSKDEMKKVMGGVMAANCQALVTRSDGSGTTVIENQTYDSASTASGMVHWCCASCCTASWAYHDGCGGVLPE